jgi:hypothetical protein
MKKYFFLRLIPPRPSFTQDMTEVEKKIMLRHLEYWKDLTDKGYTIVYGPVFDPKGGYGIGVVQVDTDDELKRLIDDDPANGLNRYESYPMRAVVPSREKTV